MRAAISTSLGRMDVRDFDIPTLPPDGVLVRIERAAICGSDLHSIFDGLGYLNTGEGAEASPGRPGHEGVGIVVASDTEAFEVGDKVLTLGFGTFAEYVGMTAGECIKLPADAPLAKLLMAQQLGVTIFGMQRFWPGPRDQGGVATVIGSGPIGLFFVQLAKLYGFATVIASDIEPARVQAAARCGADITVTVPDSSVVEATMDLTGGVGADLVIEAAGFDRTRAECIGAVRLGGRVGFFGYPETFGESSFPFADAFWKAPLSIEITKGAQQLPGLPTFHEAIELISTDRIDVTPLLDAEFKLDDIQAALQSARDRTSLKVQLLIGN